MPLLKRKVNPKDRHAWRHSDLAVRPVAVDTEKDPRWARWQSGGYGATAPYLPNRLGLPARRTGRPVGHVPVRRGRVRSKALLDEAAA